MRSIADILRSSLRTLSEAVFPAVCECCGRSLVDGENLLCLKCRLDIPYTNYHRDNFNELHKRLATPGLPVERAAAMFHYIKNSPYARLIQKGKYNDRPSIIRQLGTEFATSLSKENFFHDINLILPIPLHWLKRLKRGYNQSEVIADAISKVTSIPVGDNLVALPHSTQTRKNALQRASNVEGTIKVVNHGELENRHVLLIDDVITTGATLLAAAKAIHNLSPTTRISILTLAASKLS